MKITICGSLQFFEEMLKIKYKLESLSHHVKIPKKIDGTNYTNKSVEEGTKNIQEKNLIKEHYKKILSSDCILIVNYNKKGIENYIGGNSFLEMGFAYVNNKKIYLLNPIPKGLNYEEEIRGMNPIILNGEIQGIK